MLGPSTLMREKSWNKEVPIWRKQREQGIGGFYKFKVQMELKERKGAKTKQKTKRKVDHVP